MVSSSNPLSPTLSPFGRGEGVGAVSSCAPGILPVCYSPVKIAPARNSRAGRPCHYCISV